MSRMGSACSMQRQRGGPFRVHGHHHNQRRNGIRGDRKNGRDRSPSATDGMNSTRSSLRHSVVSAIPDGSIATLYPVEDNYVNDGDGRRSPKSLADLATEALCRTLPNLNGELPAGLPQDVVDDVVRSLVRHSALNATTLRVLRNCELGALSLAGCRGVTDEWLEPLGTPTSNKSGACSPELCPLSPEEDDDDEDGIESMDLDDSGNHNHRKPQTHADVFYGTFDQQSASSCSTSSFVSATSNQYGSAASALATNGNDKTTPTTPTTTTSKSSSDGAAALVEGMMIADGHPAGESALCSGGGGKMSPTSSFNGPSVGMCSPVPSVTSNLTLLDLRGSQRLTDRGLLQLTDLSRLEVAKLDNCHALTGRGLLAFSSSHRLHALSLANCRRLTDEAVINISHLLSLEALSLDGCRCLTDRSLAAMADLYNLRKLDLSQCDLITDDGLDHLEHMEALEELSLGWCRSVTDAGINGLTTQPGRREALRVLRVARCPITDEGVFYLGRLHALEELDLNGCSNVGSTALGKTLERLKRLHTLDVSYCPGILRSGWQGKIGKVKTLELCYSGVRDSHLAKLTDLPALEELNLDSCPVGDWAVSHFADNHVVPNLTSLDLADTDLTDLGMAHVVKFKRLTRLSLFYCNITNAGLRNIGQLKRLEVLNLDSREISDEGLKHLRGLRKLKSLDIFSGRITDSGCAHIAKIQSLESLELCGGGIGDLGCTLLAGLENLQSLNLSQNERISNRGAAALAALSNLRALNLSNTRVNAAALVFLSGLLKLQSLALYGCRGVEADDKGLDRLQSGLPNLKCLRLNRASDEDGMVVGAADVDAGGDGDGDNQAELLWANDLGNNHGDNGVFHGAAAAGAAATAMEEDGRAGNDDDEDDEDFYSDND